MKHHLPDDLMLAILIRLPAEELVKCRRVCKNWRALISNPEFIEKHFNLFSPIVFVQYCPMDHRERKKLKFYFLDEKLKENTKKVNCNALFHKASYKYPLLIDSCNGLLLFRDSDSKILVCNPVTKQVVKLRDPSPFPDLYSWEKEIGIFFHSSTMEYRLLFARRVKGDIGGDKEYFILTLGSKSWRRLGTFSRHAGYQKPFVVHDKFLHWVGRPNYTCKNSILVFNMDTEEFKALPHPSFKCPCPWEMSEYCYQRMSLTKMEDNGLSLCVSEFEHTNIISIWVLKDHGNWMWDRMYEVELDWDVKRTRNCFQCYEFPIIQGTIIKFGNIHNKELLLVTNTGQVFQYNIQTRSVREIQIRRSWTANLETELVMRKLQREFGLFEGFICSC
ncbi:hypothetical protein CCACVL1_09150 [Corchorus capsularis]|uniref:F-box domain-containing protein n=1 Tax=Corchorus capsularis TaxID=210143 RepID=A0A1R3IXH8_COCAP|nr:hypothetical protein CCACVL1_09150 [Corchorus capsularis]